LAATSTAAEDLFLNMTTLILVLTHTFYMIIYAEQDGQPLPQLPERKNHQVQTEYTADKTYNRNTFSATLAESNFDHLQQTL
jgi:hypothetical protein